MHTPLYVPCKKKKIRWFGQTIVEYFDFNKLDSLRTMHGGVDMSFMGYRTFLNMEKLTLPCSHINECHKIPPHDTWE
jgi:hypothetical protein